MAEQSKMELARQVVAACSREAYGDGHGPNADIRSRDNVVRTYTNPTNQLKYIHMYFAKYVALWRLLARAFDPGGAYELWSLGAGPLLDVIGWLWDRNDHGEGITVTGVDALDWRAAKSMPELRQLRKAVGRGVRFNDRPKTYFPGPGPPGQVRGCGATTVLQAEEIPEGAIVLIPYVMNHLLGKNGGLDTAGRATLGAWLEEARRRAQLVMVADIPLIDGGHADTSYLWARFSDMLCIANEPRNINFVAETRELEGVYADCGQGWRRCSVYMGKAVVALGNRDGWRYLCRRDLTSRPASPTTTCC